MPLRIIARLDIKAPNLVKGIHLEGLRVLGAPSVFAQDYFQQGADEIHYQDIVASLYERSSIVDLVKETAEHVFVPLTVGGGLRNLSDIKTILRAGADKVCLNTAAVRRPEFITEAAQSYGRQCIVVAIESLCLPNGRREAFTNNGRQRTGLDAHDWALRAEDLGAGELLLTSVDQEGTKRGFDLDFAQKIMSRVSIPVVMHGGAGKADHVVAAAKAGASGVAIASLFHYRMLSVTALKQYLTQANVEVRA